MPQRAGRKSPERGLGHERVGSGGSPANESNQNDYCNSDFDPVVTRFTGPPYDSERSTLPNGGNHYNSSFIPKVQLPCRTIQYLPRLPAMAWCR